MDQHINIISVLKDLFSEHGPEGLTESFSFLYGAFAIAKDGIVIGANSEFIEMIGYSRDELYGTSALRLVTPKEQEGMKARFAKNDISRYEVELLSKSGEVRDVMVFPSTFSAEGESYRLTQFIDITQQKKDHTKLLRANRVVENSPTVSFVWQASEGWPVEYVSENVSRFGYSVDDFVSGTVSYESIIHPDDAERVAREVEENSVSGSSEFRQEYRIFTADKKVRWVIDSTSIIRDASGKVSHYEGVILDNTELKLAEESLKEERQRFANAFANSAVPSSILNLVTGQRLAINDEFVEMIGYSREELEQGNIFTSNVVVDKGEIQRIADKAREMKFVKDESLTVLTKQKEQRHLLVNARLIVDSNAEEFIFSFLDVTEQLRAEKQLKDSLIQLQLAIETANLGIWTWDLDSDHLYWNDQTLAMFGISSKEFEQNRNAWRDQVFPEDLEPTESRFAKIMEGKSVAGVEFRVMRRDGIPRNIEASGIPLYDKAGKVVKLFGINRDVTEAKQAREEISRINALLESVAKMAKIGGWELDLTTMAPYFTKQTFEICELPEGEPPAFDEGLEYFSPEVHPLIQEAVRNAIEKNHPFDLELPFVTAKGKDAWVRALGAVEMKHGKAVRMRGALQDITERKEAEEVMARSLFETVRAIAMTVEQRDPYTAGHMNRTTELAAAIAMEFGWPVDRINGLSLAGSIHDLGKIYVPIEILNRPGKLSDAEFDLIKTHSQVGYDIIKGIDFPWPIADAILQHHERLDGSGYPQGLKGDEICMEAQILAVADMLEAICSHRPYRPAKGMDFALKIIQEDRGSKLNAEAVDACVDLITSGRFKFE